MRGDTASVTLPHRQRGDTEDVWYAQTPARRLRQLLGDALVVGWVLACAAAGRLVHDLVRHVAEPALRLQGADEQIRATLADTGDRLGGVPLAGEELRGAFDRLAGLGAQVSTAGSDLAATMGTLAIALGLAAAIGPALAVLLPWLVLRIRFARRAAEARRFVDAAADLDLFALRALAHQPMRRLARISDDPAGAWRGGDPHVTRALAALELAERGLLPPPVPVGQPGSPDPPEPGR